MATRKHRPERRGQPLSRERIVEAAVELLDAEGENGLTFRALSRHLATGPGAIYWHVANKSELLDATTDAVVADALTIGPAEAQDSPQAEIHALALGLFDAVDRHPWLAAQLAVQLARSPWRSVAPRIFESLGRQVRALGVPESSWFTSASALMHYILGAAGQNAANAASGRVLGAGVDRDEILDTVSTAWEQLDPDDYPFTRAVAHQMRGHDDREQFLAGIDLVLTGITAAQQPTT
ncbi:TetR/AcrR family transcriptional regulator [Streptomyces sp. NBC_01089]|uniref:TetR/AcrR family transcriptional regulator n=1 Tax=Streptomyces sp. NBC_01089 TaxID=2903747 RepID=UPI0038692722|nr:TetR family transcriptional regulator [Streptomyces sp. NBC_01089]